eukprot:759865-Hanusia_phi.AAC.3
MEGKRENGKQSMEEKREGKRLGDGQEAKITKTNLSFPFLPPSSPSPPPPPFFSSPVAELVLFPHRKLFRALLLDLFIHHKRCDPSRKISKDLVQNDLFRPKSAFLDPNMYWIEVLSMRCKELNIF